jgi:hypothetical protein
MRRLALAFSLSSALSLAACNSGTVLDNHDASSPEIRGLSRLTEGGYVAGRTEKFRALHDASGLLPQWSASGGALEADGDTVSWTLPDEGEATLTFALVGQQRTATASWRFSLTGGAALTPYAAVAGPVDGTSDANGSLCDLGFNGSGNPMVAYRNDKHPSLSLSTWSGTAWQTQIVDGMGFQTGGLVLNFAMAVAADGAPHFVYTLSGNGVWYATRSASGWLREQVATTVTNAFAPAIALDPAHGGRPTVAYSTANLVMSFAWRTGANAWTTETPTLTGSATGISGNSVTGGIAISAAGVIHLSFTQGGTYYYLGRYTPGQSPLGTVDNVYLVTDYNSTYHPVGFDPSGKPMLDGGGALYVVTPGATTLLSGSSKAWPYEAVLVDWSDFVFKGGKPWLVSRHGTDLELISTDASNFYTYTLVGAADAARPAVELDPAGAPHLCFARGGKTYYQ